MNEKFGPPRNDLLRTIFINFFIIAFIIMVYVSISNLLGSSSIFLIRDFTPNISIGITLIVFAFFSNIAGSYRSFIGGFLGELLFQLYSIQEFYLEWCILIGILGLMCGLYKYKPLKYLNSKNVLYLVITFLISSVVCSLFIIPFAIFFNQDYPSDVLFFSSIVWIFFLHVFISTTIFSTPLLILYDYIFSKKERVIYNEILTHHLPSESDHAFYLTFGRTYIFFCSRCSGVIIGGGISIFITSFLQAAFNLRISPEFAVFCCAVLPIPGMSDWGTQRLLFRKSNTEFRLITGFILGIALHLMSFTSKYILIMIFLLVIYFSLLGVLMFIGHRKELKKFKEEVDQTPKEEKIG